MDKVCKNCGKTKDVSEFNKHKYAKDGYRSMCRECENSIRNSEAEERRKNFDPSIITHKVCKDCGELKTSDQFYTNFYNSDCLESRCIDCQSEWVKDYKKQNPEVMEKIYQHRKEQNLKEKENRVYPPKTCTECNETKDHELFLMGQMVCRVCGEKRADDKRRERVREREKMLSNREIPTVGKKICTDCNKEKDLSERKPLINEV